MQFQVRTVPAGVQIIYLLSLELILAVNILKRLGDPDFAKTDINSWNLLCGDGKTSQPFNINNVKNCNLGVVPEKWMVLSSFFVVLFLLVSFDLCFVRLLKMSMMINFCGGKMRGCSPMDEHDRITIG